MIKQFPKIYLASRSPRRRELLDQISVCYKVVVPNVAEQRVAAEPPADYVCRLASSKAKAGWEMTFVTEKRPVLGADTVVVLGDRVMEKPLSREHGIEMLTALSGRVHQVMTGMALVTEKGCDCVVSVSRVHFREIPLREQLDYWATGEPEGKAGGYAIQGLAAAFIERIEGSYSGIMGLPLFELTKMLATKTD
ncbi:MAG: Maf family nucleotide pyrophosphatase [Gammaproteobacteria bacterium]|nr:Maf family nucleotide pyrophosphatase [Gammaproteobacteria bacterium]MCF6230814.1 Maf family nucleotide pyrophosphatase [Gammaproteobacteria bacterium]